MKNNVQEMLSGAYSTDQILAIFEKYPLSKLSGEQLAMCLEGVLSTATFHINTGSYKKPFVVPAGTGGDMQSTVNISTMAGFVLAASDACTVALYGNRSASGKCGKMDVLEALGIPIELSVGEVEKLLHENNIAPLFARTVYPGMRFVAEARTQFGQPTFFNVIMPLAVPLIGDTRLVLGVGNLSSLPLIAALLSARETQKALLVHNNRDNLDELSYGENLITFVTTNHSELLSLVTEKVGIRSAELHLLQANTVDDCVRLFEQTLTPQENSSQLIAIRNVVAMNAACGLYLAGNSSDNFLEVFPQHYQKAQDILQSGKARDVLESLRRKS